MIIPHTPGLSAGIAHLLWSSQKQNSLATPSLLPYINREVSPESGGEFLKPTKASGRIQHILLRVYHAEPIQGFIWDCLTATWANLSPSDCQASLSLISAL
jgi:hypothetical protein